MNNSCTIQAKTVRKIAIAVESKGVDTRLLFEATNFKAETLDDPDARIPFAQLVEIYEVAAQLTGDPNFGLHIGENVSPAAFEVLGYTALNSATVGEAFARIARYHSIWTNGAEFILQTNGSSSMLVYRYLDKSIKEHRQDCEMTFAAVASLCPRIALPSWSAGRLEFQHAAPADCSEHQRIFRCEVLFGRDENKLTFDSSTLALSIHNADPTLGALLDRHAEELLSKYLPRDSLLDKVRRLIGLELRGGDPSLDRIADKLGLTPRTLQRKLRESDTSHNDLLTEMRRELALSYLRDQKMAICEVAYLLGFSESSSFHRAFKRWTGKTPNEYRLSHLE